METPDSETADLSMVPTFDLIRELGDRHGDGCVIILERDEEGDEPVYSRYFRGPMSRMVGMVARTSRYLERRCNDLEENPGDDEDDD